MKNSAIYILFILIPLISCRKYDHQEKPLPSCDLCTYADSVSGTYRGLAYGISIPNNPNLPMGYSDSVTITVEHFFHHQDPYEDSVYMYFHVNYTFDYSGTTRSHDIRLTNPEGNVYDNAFGGISGGIGSNPNGYFILRPDSLFIKHTDKYWSYNDYPFATCNAKRL